tara:strand:+ start:239 stop:349 length:111 start_codon:yes stop_codon:yes gene_type:complete
MFGFGIVAVKYFQEIKYLIKYVPLLFVPMIIMALCG